MIRLGLLSFSDGRERVHAGLAPDILQHQTRVTQLVEADGSITVLAGQDLVHSNASARREAARLAALQPDGYLFNIPVFPFPNFIVIATQIIGRGPFLLLGPHDARYPGLTGLLAAAGALHQLGVPHERLWLDLQDAAAAAPLVTFARAAAAATRLRGQVYGLIGGRSIGMATGAAPAELWQSRFGVDVDHVDQCELLRRAERVAAADVEEGRAWLTRHVREVAYDGAQLTPEKLDHQLRCYIALKQLVDELGFDFVGLKCHYELSEFYSVQCISAAFLNDPYDWRGAKAPVPLACEADSDGALTMQVLHLVSGHPACLLDLRFFDKTKNVYVMPNCGAAPTWYAARSDDPAENLRLVRLVPSIRKYAGGGAHVQFVFRSGPLTLARLTRSPEGYRMFIALGDTVEHGVTDVAGADPNWPHAFVRLQADPGTLVQTLQANHVHAVAGDYRSELTTLCRLLGVRPVVLDNSHVASFQEEKGARS